MASMKTIFGGYLQMSWTRIKWVFLFSFFFYFLFYILKKMGYIKKYEKRYMDTFMGVFLSMECSFIFVMTLFGRKFLDEYKYDLIPFKSYWNAISNGDKELLLQIIMNIAMYIPLGFLLPCCFRIFEKFKYVMFIAFISSVSIECIQGMVRIGLVEVDDIINNTLGAAIGVLVYTVVTKLKKHWKGKFGLTMKGIL